MSRRSEVLFWVAFTSAGLVVVVNFVLLAVTGDLNNLLISLGWGMAMAWSWLERLSSRLVDDMLKLNDELLDLLKAKP